MTMVSKSAAIRIPWVNDRNILIYYCIKVSLKFSYSQRHKKENSYGTCFCGWSLTIRERLNNQEVPRVAWCTNSGPAKKLKNSKIGLSFLILLNLTRVSLFSRFSPPSILFHTDYIFTTSH